MNDATSTLLGKKEFKYEGRYYRATDETKWTICREFVGTDPYPELIEIQLHSHVYQYGRDLRLNEGQDDSITLDGHGYYISHEVWSWLESTFKRHRFKLHVPVKASPAATFNRLALCPDDIITLPDGRKLHIMEWTPQGTLKHLEAGIVPVTIKAEIRDNVHSTE